MGDMSGVTYPPSERRMCCEGDATLLGDMLHLCSCGGEYAKCSLQGWEGLSVRGSS